MNSKKVILIIVLVLVQTTGIAQVVPPPVPPPPPPGLPIDGFSSVFLIIGLIYGIHNIFNNSSS